MNNDRKYMPNKKKICKHWEKENCDDTCWGCGFEADVHRSHLKAKVHGGDNDSRNFILLCKFCHNHIQEFYTKNDNDIKYITKIFKNIHLPFFNIKMNFMISKAKSGLISYMKENNFEIIHFFPIESFSKQFDELGI